MDHIITTLPASHTDSAIVVVVVLCVVLMILLVTYSQVRSRWILAWCVPLVATSITTGCYGGYNASIVRDAKHPLPERIITQFGLRSQGKGVYYDLDHNTTYDQCHVTTNMLDENHLTSRLTCRGEDGQPVAIKAPKR